MADETITTETSTETATTETPTTETATTATTETTTSTDDTIDLGAKTEATTEKVEEKADERTDDEKAADAEKATLFGAPAEGEAYEISGLPEGMEIDKDALAALDPVARQLGLSNAGTSALAKVYAEQLPKVLEQHQAALTTQILDTRKAWEGESLAAIKGDNPLKTAGGDVLGFDGKAPKAVMADAARALDRLAPAGFREFLSETGLSQHPSMVAFCYQAGKALAEDTSFEGGKETGKVNDASGKTGGMSPTKFFNR